MDSIVNVMLNNDLLQCMVNLCVISDQVGEG